MSTSAYDIGDMRTLSVTFAVGGTPTDPIGATFRMLEPDGTETVYVYGTDAELVKDDTGDYHVNWTFTQAGRHAYRFEGTGAVVACEGAELHIRRKVTT